MFNSVPFYRFRPLRALFSLLDRLTQPARSVPAEEWLLARLLAASLLIALTLMLMVGTITLLRGTYNVALTLSFVGGLGLLYAVSHTRYYRLAGWGTIFLFQAAPIIAVIQLPERPEPLLFTTISIILSSVLFAPRITYLLTALHSAGLLLALYLLPLSAQGAVPNLIVFTVMMGALLTMIAITRQRDRGYFVRQARELADSELRYRLMAENTTDLIARHAKDGTFLYVSPACRALLGYEPEELIGTTGQMIVHPEDWLTLRDAWLQTMQEGSSRITYRAVRKDGGIVWFESSGRLIRDPQTGEPWEMVGVSRDVTGRMLVEDAMRRSEARFRAAAEGSMDAFFLLHSHRDESGTTTDFVFDEINERGETLLNMPAEQVIGQHLCELFPINRQDGSFERYRTVVETGIPLWEEFPVDQAYGPGRWLQHQVVRVEDGIAITSRDVTERKRAESRLEASRDMLQRTIQQMPIGIQVFDPDGICTDVNQTHLEIFGIPSREAVVGKFNIRHDALARQIGTLDGFERALANQVVHIGEVAFDFTNADPRYTGTSGKRFISVSFFPLHNEQDRIVSVVALNRDVTERREAEHERIELELQRERVQMLQHLITDTSHDLKTPLATLNTGLYLLKRFFSDPERREHYAQVLQAQVTNLVKILDDMDSMAKLDSETFIFEPLDVNELTRQIVNEHNALAAEKGQLLTCTGEPVPLIVADAIKLRRAITNLVANALNYTPRGGQISTQVHLRGRHVIVEVRDTGIGIRDEEIPLIFERFYRAEDVRGTHAGGSGLGLAITRKIIEAHSGSIEVESRFGVGSTFRIRLPVPTPRADSGEYPAVVDA